jgi:branched-chain amino acid transport system substrate-binding protein
MMNRLIPLLLSCAFTLTMLAGCEEIVEQKQTPLDIKLGVIGPFSGEHEEWGKSGLLGVEAVIKYHQAQNRKLQVQLITEDDQSTPAQALVALEKLAVEENVDAVLILSGSKTMLAITEVADRYKVPIVSTLSSHPGITETNWVNQIIFDDEVQGTVAALFVMDELLIERSAVVWDGDDPHSKELADSFRRTYQEAGGTVLSIDISGRKDDTQSIVNQLKNNAIEFVYLPVEVGSVVIFEQGVQDAGYNPQGMVSDGILSQMMLEYRDNLDLLDGLLATDIFTGEIQLSEFGNSVKDNLKRQFHTPATTLTALGCEGGQVVLTAIARCGKNPQNECVNRMIRSGNKFEGVLEPFTIDLDGKAQRPVYINKITNKQLRFLLKVN